MASIGFRFRRLWTSIWIFFPVVLTIVSISIGLIHAEEYVSIEGGAGNIQIKTQNEQFYSDSKINVWHAGLGLDLEQEDYPLRIAFRGSYFSTDNETEKWISRSSGPLNENHLDVHGLILEAHGYYMPYSPSFLNGGLIFKPYLGGGLVCRRIKLDRGGFNGSMFPLYPLTSNMAYYMGDQSIVEVGAMPSFGARLELPKSDLEFNLNLGWAFLGINSNVNYHLSCVGSEEYIYPYLVHTSGSRSMGKMELIKTWDSLSVEIGWQWEKTQINDKSILFFSDGPTDYYLPFPEYEITRTLGRITLKYLF